MYKDFDEYIDMMVPGCYCTTAVMCRECEKEQY
jgi:hypothetical protein